MDAGRGRLDRECTHTISRLGSLALTVKLGASHAPCMLVLDATAAHLYPIGTAALYDPKNLDSIQDRSYSSKAGRDTN